MLDLKRKESTSEQLVTMYQGYYGFRRRRVRTTKATKKRGVPSHTMAKLSVRVGAHMQVESSQNLISGRVFLADLREAGVGVFLTHNLPIGTELHVVIEYPKHLFVTARVRRCSLYTLRTAVLSHNAHRYRALLEFVFESDVERRSVADYCRWLRAEDTEFGPPEPYVEPEA